MIMPLASGSVSGGSASTSAAIVVLAAAIRVLNHISRNRRRRKIPLQRGRLRFIVRQNRGGLSALARRQFSHLQLLTEHGNGFVLGIDLVLAHRVEDSLRAGIVRFQHIAQRVGNGIAIRAGFRGNRILQISRGRTVFTAAVLEGALQGEVLVHVRHLTAVGRDFSSRESVVDRLGNTGESRAKAVADAVNSVHHGALVKAALHFAADTAVLASPAIAPAVPPSAEDQQDDDPNLLS